MIQKQRALLVGININNQTFFKDSMEELKNLAAACELEIAGVVEQNLKAVNTAYHIGSGKVKEVRLLIDEVKADVVVFSNELTPSQLRNLEDSLEREIIDRTMLIIEIFAKRAKTREAKLQVEVARLKFMLPRLEGLNDNLSRQGGGSGLRNRGSGETKLELDKRRIESKIAELSKELELLVNERNTQRSKRNKAGLPSVALVGYTNAGKSTLMNALVEVYQKNADKKVFEKDMLFATLETSVRNITLPDKKAFLLSDTVGFISKLPHELVKAFRSTLEEVRTADLLLHVVDSSNPNFVQQINVTNETLKQIGADKIPTILVFNKADLTDVTIPCIEDGKVYISAKKNSGMEELVGLIGKEIFTQYMEYKMLVPYDRGNIVAYFNENADVKAVSYERDGTLLTVECRVSDYKRFEKFAFKG
ncbi:GTPase HflX [Ruminiclostridium cellobioparum]|uniref:GTPase HflX n=1 Tax=Ruminiclostridium cellobioparum TaxID=29355 RepID=UPI0004850B1B|nr:GTPase HflX [Ruminiclostridium cellobioparum]